MLLSPPPLVGGRRRTTAPWREIGETVQPDEVEREHPAHGRLGCGPVQLVDPAAAFVGQKHAASIRTSGQYASSAQQSLAHHDLDAAKYRRVLPPLLAEPGHVRRVERNGRAAAAIGAAATFALLKLIRAAAFRVWAEMKLSKESMCEL